MFNSVKELALGKQKKKYIKKQYSCHESLFSELESLELLVAESEELLQPA